MKIIHQFIVCTFLILFLSACGKKKEARLAEQLAYNTKISGVKLNGSYITDEYLTIDSVAKVLECNFKENYIEIRADWTSGNGNVFYKIRKSAIYYPKNETIRIGKTIAEVIYVGFTTHRMYYSYEKYKNTGKFDYHPYKNALLALEEGMVIQIAKSKKDYVLLTFEAKGNKVEITLLH